MGFSIRTPIGRVWRMSYLRRCRVRVGHPDTARGWGVYASLTRTGMNNSILKHHVDLRFNFLFLEMRILVRMNIDRGNVGKKVDRMVGSS